jgi:hypothetical protein
MIAPSLTHRFIQADFLTSSHRFVGEVRVTNAGLMGILNDAESVSIEIITASLARIHMPTKLVEGFRLTRLIKSQVIAVCLARREDIGPQAMGRGGYARMSEYSVMLTTPVYELKGSVEWSGRFDFNAIMAESRGDFIALYDAVISAVLIPALRIKSPAILFNRAWIDSLSLLDQRIQETG